MTINMDEFTKDMLKYMTAVGHRELYRVGTNMYKHHTRDIERIEDRWLDEIEQYVGSTEEENQ